jgi:phage baseplate assembly protein W
MAVQRISRAFKDISLSFEPHPVTKDLPVLKNEAAIRKSVRNIVETIRGERFFDSLFGSEVRSSLFDFVDLGTATFLESEIATAIQNYEPRISELSVSVEARPDDNAFEVTVNFSVVGQSLPLQEYSFILEAAR